VAGTASSPEKAPAASSGTTTEPSARFAAPRETDESKTRSGDRDRRLEPYADERRGRGRLRQHRDERARAAALREREARPIVPAPDDEAASVGPSSNEPQADEKIDRHPAERPAVVEIDAPEHQAPRALRDDEPDVGPVEPNLLHRVAAPRDDHIKAFSRTERHRHVVRCETISARRRKAPPHDRTQGRRVDRPRRSVLSRDDDVRRIDVVVREVDGRAGIRVEPNGRRFPRHVRVACVEPEIRIPLMLVEQRPRGIARPRNAGDDRQEDHERTRDA
jgi:hypothetical protein